MAAKKSNTFNLPYLGLLITAGTMGFVTFKYGHSLISGNEEARNVIVTVFSILAGFLIAVMTLYGNPSIMSGKWIKDTNIKKKIKTKLTRHKWLFYLYLSTLLLVFVATFIDRVCPNTVEYVERTYFALSVAAFILSFGLPSSLMSVQMSILENKLANTKTSTPVLDR